MRIICCRFGNKFADWHVDNLKHMIDKYSGLEYDSFEVIEDNHITIGLINFKCIVSLKTVKIYTLI